MQDARTQLACFKKLAGQERGAAPARISAAQALLDEQQVREQELQEKYKELLGQKADLSASAAVAPVAIA